MSNIFNLFSNLTTVQKSLIVSILSIVLFIGSSTLSFSIFGRGKIGNLVVPGTMTIPGPAAVISEDPSEPKTESCPLNGQLHTKKAREVWEKRMPLAVMIENHTESRPQSGLSSADIIYEVVAEGGITRFMALFYCNLGDIQIGPVRSARTYFLDWLSEYGALYAHVGGANTPGPANALGQIIKYGIKDLNQFSIGFPTFWRDYQRLGRPVATEHTMYSTTQKLWDIGTKRGFAAVDEKDGKWGTGFVSWIFKDPAANLASVTGSASGGAKVNVEFWSGYSSYSVTWDFDPATNLYKRSNGGEPHLDLNNKQQLTAKNIVVQFERESNANDGYENNAHLLYGTTGQGRALIFQDGKVISGKWSKASRTARTKYTDDKGSEIKFNKGLIWIETVPEGAKVSYS